MGSKTIVRYGNRKLYDKEAHKYVKLSEIEKVIKSGQDIIVVDNDTKEDVTGVILGQVIVSQQRGGADVNSILHGVVRATT